MKKSRFNHGETSQNSERRFGNNSSNLNDSKNAPKNGRRFGNNSSNQNQQNRDRDKESKMSMEDKFMLVNETITSFSNAIKSVSDFTKEKEITKRIKSEQGSKIAELDNDLKKALSADQIEIKKIQTNYKLNYKTLENENEQGKRDTLVVLKMLEIVDKLLNTIEINEKEYSFDHPRIIELTNNLHDQSINLTKLLKLNN